VATVSITDSREFLETHYKLMRDATRFMLAYARHDAAGKLSHILRTLTSRIGMY